MQKKLIAVAIAAALAPAAAMADTTVYGRIHADVTSISGVTGQSETLSVNSNSSRFGVKGSEDLGGGLSALYQIESSVAANGNGGNVLTGARDTFIGLTGGFGTFLVGRLPLDNQYVYDSNLFADQVGDAANFTQTTTLGRVNGALHYVSPNMSGFSGSLSFVPGQSVDSTLDTVNTAATHGDNSYAFKLNYAANGINASLFSANVKSTATSSQTTRKPLSIAGGYDFGNGMVTAQYVKYKSDTAGVVANDRKIWNIGGKFNVASNAAVKAQYSHAGTNNSTANTGATMWALGYDYSLSKRTGVYVAYAQANNDSAASFTMNNWGHEDQNNTLTAGDDPRGFSVGLTHNF